MESEVSMNKDMIYYEITSFETELKPPRWKSKKIYSIFNWLPLIAVNWRAGVWKIKKKIFFFEISAFFLPDTIARNWRHCCALFFYFFFGFLSQFFSLPDGLDGAGS